MSNLENRERALQMRRRGMSYSQIKGQLSVAKSTLSSWLSKYPLPKKRIRELRDRNEIRIERFRQTMQRKRKERLAEIYKQSHKKLLPLSPRELLIAGLFLYWGEGTKTDWSKVTVANTDPTVLRFFIYWLTAIMKVPRKNLKAALQLYSDMDAIKEIRFWARALHLPARQFIKPYIKTSLKSRINHKGSFGHGTCTVSVYRVPLKEKILMDIKVIADYYGLKQSGT